MSGLEADPEIQFDAAVAEEDTCSPANEIALELCQCAEDVEDELAEGVVVSICSCRLRKPMSGLVAHTGKPLEGGVGALAALWAVTVLAATLSSVRQALPDHPYL